MIQGLEEMPYYYNDDDELDNLYSAVTWKKRLKGALHCTICKKDVSLIFS